MKLWLALREAFVGWRLILRGDADWRASFKLTLPGLLTALALFYLFAFVAVFIASLDVGVPTLEGFFNVMLMQSLWLVALLGGIYGTRLAVPTDAPLLELLVPGMYAFIAYLVIGTLVSLAMGPLLPILWIGLAYLLYRLGRAAGGWTVGVSAAFGMLTVVLLVGLPMTLYMLATSLATNAA